MCDDVMKSRPLTVTQIRPGSSADRQVKNIHPHLLIFLTIPTELKILRYFWMVD